MLPFTKRPGRDDENDAPSKDDMPAATGSARKLSDAPRAFQPSISDEETTMIPAKALGLTGPSASARGLSAPPPRAAVPPARSSARNMVEDDEDDDGRTQIRDVGRGRPKANGAFGMATAPQPSAVLRASLQAPAGRVPPDRSSARAVDRPSARPAPSVKPPSVQEEREHTVQLDMTGGGPRVLGSSGGLPVASASRSGGYPMASSSGALPVARLGSSGPMPASPRLAGHSGAYPGVASTGGFPVVSTGGFPVAAGSSGQLPAPAHFMVPQAPYSGPGLDPPGAAITLSASKTKRPAMSWAVSLMVMGLAVGIASVLITQGKAEAFADTSAAFVDPARAGEPAALQPGVAPAAVAPPAIAAAQPAAAVEAPVAVAQPAAAQPAAAQPAAAQPAAAQPVAAPPPVAPKAAAPAPQPKAVAWSAPKAPEAPKAQEGPKPVAHATSSGASGSSSKSSSSSASTGTSKSHASSSSSKGSGGHDDAEMKAAMEALQKAQTESSF